MYVCIPGVCGSTGGLRVGLGAGGPVKVPLEGPRLEQFSVLLHSLKGLDGNEVVVDSLPLSLLGSPCGACE